MAKQLGIVIVILVASCGAGAIARSTWYNSEKSSFPPMPWVRETEAAASDLQPVKKKNTPPAKVESEAPTDTPPGDSNNGAKSVASKNDEPAADPCACDQQIKGLCVAQKDCILKHLRAKDAYIIDAREGHDFEEGHLVNALHIPSSDIYGNMEKVTNVIPMVPDSRIIVYCGGGECEASKNVAVVLRDFGYTNVWIYENGWDEIEASGEFGNFMVAGN